MMTRKAIHPLKIAAAVGVALLVWGLVLAYTSSPAWAADITVGTTDDEQNTDRDCSLREAIEAAKTDAAVDECAAGSGEDTIIFDLGSSATITLDSWLGQLPTITNAAGLTIDGEDAEITVSGGGTVRVFAVGRGANLALENLTVSDGFVDASTPAPNNKGGGAYVAGGTLTISNSTFSDNSAPYGGGVATELNGLDRGTVIVTDSTFAANSSPFGDSIFRFASDPPATLGNSILVNSPTTSGGNCRVFGLDDEPPIIDGGYNIDDDTSCGFTDPTSNTTDSKLDALADNGGPTQTHALQSDSPAIDAIPSGTSGCGTVLATDQRDVERPQGGNGDSTLGCDMGAYEVDVEMDTTAPFVTETSPLQLKKTDNVTAEFSEPVQNVNSSTFILERKNAAKKASPRFDPVNATVTPRRDGLSAVLDSGKDLRNGEYRATITTAVTDLADPANALDQDSVQEGNQPKVWTFEVAK